MPTTSMVPPTSGKRLRVRWPSLVKPCAAMLPPCGNRPVDRTGLGAPESTPGCELHLAILSLRGMSEGREVVIYHVAQFHVGLVECKGTLQFGIPPSGLVRSPALSVVRYWSPPAYRAERWNGDLKAGYGLLLRLVKQRLYFASDGKDQREFLAQWQFAVFDKISEALNVREM